ncbi:PRC-barrel domain-containing protein [Ferdinandcohnia quinoae]|uniref:PRC-barrel domain-containing protein n=1 Tax=Fredinandcohnia quinoae TaxID=2918902 RepID=A0AAW5EC98_9BACI|nr:PRC-barrel domain-containing protein [Fredinandcohnia sp. SECRCQ15]MCH1627681.1 PRC-barrel domain-containing protein [Fredinandcohnia sp. SECRCQ15]
MRTFTLLKDLPVYDEQAGKLLGRVSDICITNEGKVSGLLVKGKGFFEKNRLAPIECISSFGNDGVMVSDKGMLEQLDDESEKTTYFLHSHHGLFQKPILTSEGEKLGLLEDVYFTEEMGTIIGYEITDGFFADITEGKKVVKAKQPFTVGEDVIVIDL